MASDYNSFIDRLVLKAVLLTSFLSQSAVAVFLWFNGSLAQFCLVTALPLFVAMVLGLCALSGIDLFAFSSKPRRP